MFGTSAKSCDYPIDIPYYEAHDTKRYGNAEEKDESAERLNMCESIRQDSDGNNPSNTCQHTQHYTQPFHSLRGHLHGLIAHKLMEVERETSSPASNARGEPPPEAGARHERTL
jgi:hypothetical protein